MKLRKLEFKIIDMTDEVWSESKGEFEIVKQGKFVYRDILRQIVNQPGKAGQLSSEEVLKSVLLYGKLKDALRDGKEFLFIDNEDYQYLIVRLNSFPWAIAHSCVADFITYLRELKEESVDVTPKLEAPKSDVAALTA